MTVWLIPYIQNIVLQGSMAYVTLTYLWQAYGTWIQMNIYILSKKINTSA